MTLPTDTAPPARHEGGGPTGSKLDRWWGALVNTPAKQRLWAWGGPLAVTLLAAVLRLVNLAHPHSLVFDETFYVKDSYTLLNLGYEANWPANSDTDFNAGNTDGYLTTGSFAVHPPFGKWVIALGLALFGADSSLGWRISVAVCGILLVLLVTLIAKKLFRSTLLATIAGFLLAIDGHAIVMSRVALLDGILALFCLLGVGAVLMDREFSARLLEQRLQLARMRGQTLRWGPALWFRPWLLAAAVAFGLASSVKWSGLYFLAGFAVYTLVVDAFARRRVGLPPFAAAAILKQGPVTFLLLVPVSIATYLVTWTSWFNATGGMYRNWVENAGPTAAWAGMLSWVPYDWQNFWHLEAAIYNYHVNEHSPHPYQANPLTWLFMTRPTQMYVNAVDGGYENITSVANPLIWYAGTAAILYLVYRLIRKREWVVGFILMGMLVGYVPWLAYTQRTVFQFYTIAFEPFMILGLVFVIGLILGSKNDPAWRRVGALRSVGLFLIVAVLITAFFYPVWTAQAVPSWLLSLHYWLPSWR